MLRERRKSRAQLARVQNIKDTKKPDSGVSRISIGSASFIISFLKLILEHHRSPSNHEEKRYSRTSATNLHLSGVVPSLEVTEHEQDTPSPQATPRTTNGLASPRQSLTSRSMPDFSITDIMEGE